MGALQWILLLGAACQSFGLHRSMSPKERHHIFGHEEIDKVPEYWLDKPRKLTHNTNDLFYNITYRGRDEVFRLWPHKKLFGDEFHMITRDANASSLSFSLSDQECTYQGESIDNPNTKISLVGCGDRMHGMILYGEDSHYLIQPHSKTNQHIIHKRSIDHMLEKHSCLFDPKDDPYPEDRFTHNLFGGHSSRLAVTKDDDLTIELAVFADDAMWRHFVELYGNRADAEMHRFILAAVNNIDILYGQRAINPTIMIRIVRYEVIKTPPASLTKQQHHYGDVDKLLDSFCDYQAHLNPKGDENPKHWDHALLFSGYDLYRDGLKTVAGYAPVKGMCSESRSCTINEGLDFGSVFVVTHEMGHSLGMYHDGDNECDLRCCIMSPSVGTGKTQWSTCSVKEFSVFVGKLGQVARPPNCLRDLPIPGTADRAIFKDRESPGQQFTLGEQCAVFHGECWKHELRDGQSLEEVCEMVWCGNGEGIIRTAHPALEGTNCGPNLWCRNGQCVPATRLLPQIDGQWGTWNESPNSCRAKCSECEIYGQLQLRRSTRLCNRPASNNGGRECIGDDARGIVCDPRPCGGSKIDEYATSTCTKLKNDPDNPNPQLSGMGLQFEQAPCKIWCQLELSNNIRTVSNFPDGTPCGDGNYCIKGECRPLLCNGNAVAETEADCPYGTRYRVPSTVATTPTTTTTTTPPPRPSTTAQMPQERRISNLQRLSHPDGSNIPARRIQFTTRTPQNIRTRNGNQSIRDGATIKLFKPTTERPGRSPMWSLWSEWSECLTVGCGERGIKVRIRRCVGDTNEYIRDDSCRGHNRETAHCTGQPCNNLSTRRMPREMPVTPPTDKDTVVTTTPITKTSTDTTVQQTTVTVTQSHNKVQTITPTITTPTTTQTPTTTTTEETLVIEVQDDVQELSMTSSVPPSTTTSTTINPRLAPLLPKSAIKTTTSTTTTTTTEEGYEDYKDDESLQKEASISTPEKDEKPSRAFAPIVKIDADSSTSDDVIDVPEPTTKKMTSSGGFERIDDDDVIDVPQPRTNRGGRKVNEYNERGRKDDASNSDYRVRNVPIRQFVPDPLNPTVLRERNVAITQLLPFAGSLESLPGPNQPLNPDPLNFQSGINHLKSLLEPLFPNLDLPTLPPNVPHLPHAHTPHPHLLQSTPSSIISSTPSQGLLPIRNPRPISPSQSNRSINPINIPLPPNRSIYSTQGGIIDSNRIKVYPGPPPSDEEIIARSLAAASLLDKKAEIERPPHSPFDGIEQPIRPVSPINQTVTQTTKVIPTTTSTTPSIRHIDQQPRIQTAPPNRPLPAIYFDNGDPVAAKREADAAASRVPKAIREAENTRKDSIIIVSPSSSSLINRISSSPYLPNNYNIQYPGNTVYVVKGGGIYAYPRVPSPSFTTASYIRPQTYPTPRPHYRTAESYSTPTYPSTPRIVYGPSPSYTTTPYPVTPAYTTPKYSTPKYSTPKYTSPPTTYPTTPLYKPPPPEWGPWTPCTVTCGNGTRTRKIDNCGGDSYVVVSSTPTSTTSRVSVVEGLYSSTPSYTVEPFCVETEVCALEPCWKHSEWSEWNGCSKECGMGFSLRRRTCVLGVCPGPFSESRRCEGNNCELPSIWSDWGTWSECSATCGVGTKLRTRTCQSVKCNGSNSEARRCQTPTLCYPPPPPTPEDENDKLPSRPIIDPITTPPVPPIINHIEDDWLSWNTCSTSCGLGTQIRRHRTSNRVQHRSCFVASCNDFVA